MVPNPPFHPHGDFALGGEPAACSMASFASTYGNIGVYDTALFSELPAARSSNCSRCIATGSDAGLVSGELYTGPLGQRGHARPNWPHSTPRCRRSDHDNSRTAMNASRKPIRCSISRAFRTSMRFAPSTSRRPSTRCSHEARGDRRRRCDRHASPRPGIPSSSRSPTRSIASIAHGARSVTSMRCQHAGIARRLQRAICQKSPRSTPSSHRICACTSAMARCALRRHSRRSDPAKQQLIDNELRDFRLGGALLDARKEGAIQGRPGRARESVGAVRRQRARRDQRVGALRRRRGGARRRSARRASPKRAAQARGRRARRLQTHAAHAVLSAGDDVRGQSRAARDAASRVFDARLRPRREAGMGQRADRHAHSRAAPRSSDAARLCEFRRGVAGAEDGDGRRRSARVPARPRRAARKPFAERDYAELQRIRREPSSAFRRSKRGTSPTRREQSEGAPLRLLRAGSPAPTSRRTACSPGSSASSRRSTDIGDPRGARADVASGRALFRRHRSRRRARRPVLSRPLRARRQAGRRVDGRRDQSPPHGRRTSSIRSPISRAIFRRRSTASRRHSRTTKSSRSSTSSAMACISC